jgi:putative cell wall-binding protein
MEKTTNLLIADLENEIMNKIFESKLPAVVVSLMMDKINNRINTETNAVLEVEKKRYEQGLAKEISEEANKKII